MFYQSEDQYTRAAVVLTPEEAKKLIAKAVPRLDEVQRALKQGIVIIAGGSTNGYITREITGSDIDIHRYTVGRIYRGKLDSTPEEKRIKPSILVNGQPSELTMAEALDKFTGKDVFIKGANAVDSKGNAGVLAANPKGGTVGASWALVIARGAQLICPVGLEKLIPSVEKACFESGQERFDYSMGHKVALMPLSGAKVVTEIQAMRILYKLDAAHIASGGILGSEGSVVLSVKGAKDDVERMWEEVNSLKNRE